MQEQETDKTPVLRRGSRPWGEIVAYRKIGEERSVGTKVGAAFATETGSYTLVFDYIPARMDETRLCLFPIRKEGEAEGWGPPAEPSTGEDGGRRKLGQIRGVTNRGASGRGWWETIGAAFSVRGGVALVLNFIPGDVSKTTLVYVPDATRAAA